jgi:hypothetical protein
MRSTFVTLQAIFPTLRRATFGGFTRSIPALRMHA